MKRNQGLAYETKKHEQMCHRGGGGDNDMRNGGAAGFEVVEN
jgi:hypothetical protein